MGKLRQKFKNVFTIHQYWKLFGCKDRKMVHVQRISSNRVKLLTGYNAALFNKMCDSLLWLSAVTNAYQCILNDLHLDL